ncbi:MAG: deaminase [Deltaproteobacteria bacterium]|nr:deaminase [Deltaproteobacteria bacterium]
MRPSWDEYFMLIAKLVSTRSTCNSRPTGAVLVKDRQMDDGTPYCHRRALKIADVDKYNYCRASHAEANAIAQAARYGVAIKGAALYVTLQPCFVCLKLLASAQIKRVYFELAYESMDAPRDAFWDEAVQKAGIEVFQQLSISAEALTYILPSLQEGTSRRRLAATAPVGAATRLLVGALEQD